MRLPKARLATAAAACLLSACSQSSGLTTPTTVSDTAQYFPPPSDTSIAEEYRIGPLDVLNINVFQEEDLSLEEVRVDASGNILFPLIGTVQASGKTSGELSREIAARLGSRYLVDPQVNVIVSTSTSQKVTVEGSVNEAGVYELRGRTTLLQAIAMARGPSRVASLDDVVIFRTVNGQRMGAVFDLSAIRRGQSDDPQVLGNDVIVVGLSNVKAAWRDALVALPALAVFQVLR
jgi:polysaccharide biosynthesis/export protein